MNLNITGRNIEITDALKSFVEKKFQKVAQKLSDPLKANIVLSIENKMATVEMNATLNHRDIHLSETNEDMYVAINSLIKKINRKLNEIKPRN